MHSSPATSAMADAIRFLADDAILQAGEGHQGVPLGMADLGPPEWEEKSFNYGAQQGISIDKMLGLRKPKFMSPVHGTVEDFGVIACDHAI